MREVKQSTAANIMLFVADSADHVTGKTGLTLTVTASKNGAAFGSISPTVTERGNGWYNVALTSAETDTLGDLVVRATGSGADPSERLVAVVANVEADTYSRIGAPAGASISADIQTRSDFDASVDTVTVGTNNDKTGYGLTSGERDSIATALLDLANGVESGETLRQMLRMFRAIHAGIAVDDGNGTVVFKRKDGTTTALTVVYADGDRTSATVGTLS